MDHHHHHQGTVPNEIRIGAHREGLDHFNNLEELEKHPGPYRIHKVTGTLFLNIFLRSVQQRTHPRGVIPLPHR